MPNFTDTSAHKECLFCRLIAGEISSARVYEDEHTVALMDIAQVTPGHVLIVSRRHALTLLDLTTDEAAAVMRTAHRIAGAVKRAFNPPGMTLLQANGKEGGQTVFHFHLHVVPRHDNDGIALSWPHNAPPRESLEEYALRLRMALLPA